MCVSGRNRRWGMYSMGASSAGERQFPQIWYLLGEFGSGDGVCRSDRRRTRRPRTSRVGRRRSCRPCPGRPSAHVEDVLDRLIGDKTNSVITLDADGARLRAAELAAMAARGEWQGAANAREIEV